MESECSLHFVEWHCMITLIFFLPFLVWNKLCVEWWETCILHCYLYVSNLWEISKWNSDILYHDNYTCFYLSFIQCHLLWLLLYLGWWWYPYLWGGSDCRCKGCLHHVMFCLPQQLDGLILVLLVSGHCIWSWELCCFLKFFEICATCSVWHHLHATSCLPTWAVAVVI